MNSSAFMTVMVSRKIDMVPDSSFRNNLAFMIGILHLYGASENNIAPVSGCMAPGISVSSMRHPSNALSIQRQLYDECGKIAIGYSIIGLMNISKSILHLLRSNFRPNKSFLRHLAAACALAILHLMWWL